MLYNQNQSFVLNQHTGCDDINFRASVFYFLFLEYMLNVICVLAIKFATNIYRIIDLLFC